MGIVVGIFVLLVIIGFISEMSLQDIIGALIIGGILFALGNLINIGWGIYGAALGAVMATKHQKLIIAAIIGGIFFAIGNLAGLGWGIFGAVLGALIGFLPQDQKENA
jgi:hypothetical protein